MPSAGSDEITLVKIRIDMPLPTPRWVMSSPSHMTMAVPAVIVRTISATFGAVNVPAGKMSGMPPLPGVEQEHEPGGLQERQHHRDVAGVLVDLLDARLALLLQRLQLGDHDLQQLHDDRAVM